MSCEKQWQLHDSTHSSYCHARKWSARSSLLQCTMQPMRRAAIPSQLWPPLLRSTTTTATLRAILDNVHNYPLVCQLLNHLTGFLQPAFKSGLQPHHTWVSAPLQPTDWTIFTAHSCTTSVKLYPNSLPHFLRYRDYGILDLFAITTRTRIERYENVFAHKEKDT